VESTADAGAELVLLGAHALSRHPSQRAAVLLDGRSEDLWPRIARGAAPMDRSWRDTWVAVQHAVEASFAEQLGGAAWNEPAVVRAIAQIDQPIVIVASSSMPLRDLEWYGGTRPVAHPTHANRGANGIDGVVSTAVGVSLGEDRPVVAVVGDLAFLHDVSALVEGLGDESRASSLTVVVLDNGGGGIFSFLPQRNAVHGETFRRLFVTARSPRPAEVAGGFGIPAAVVGSLDELRRAMPARLARNGIEVVVCELPDHDANVATHDRVVASALEAARSVVLPAR